MEVTQPKPQGNRLYSIRAKKRRSIPESKKSGLGKAGLHEGKYTLGKKRVAATPIAKAPQTYGRWTSSDEGNDGLPSSPVEEGDRLDPVDSNESTPGRENVKQTKRMLK